VAAQMSWRGVGSSLWMPVLASHAPDKTRNIFASIILGPALLLGTEAWLSCSLHAAGYHLGLFVNVYNQVPVKILMKEDDCENIPVFEDVLRDVPVHTF